MVPLLGCVSSQLEISSKIKKKKNLQMLGMCFSVLDHQL